MRTVRVSMLSSFIFLAFAVSIAWPQTANVVISSYPSSVGESEPFDVVVDYTADLYQFGLAGRVFLEVVDADSGSILQQLWNDNDRHCYEGPGGQITFNTSVSGVTAVYFKAYVSPVEFNSWFTDELESYPTDGTYQYKWQGNGVTHDIYYQGSLILADNVDGNYCYCSGITYEVFMDAYAAYNAHWGFDNIYGLTPSQMSVFRQEWYGIYSTRCAVEAITKYKVGYEIPYTQKEKVKRGDEVQLWRWSGSGHSVVFDSWVRDTSGTITGINYWSTQSATNGIGYRTEYFGESSGLKDTACLYARKVKPVDADDWPNRYADDNTSPELTLVLPATTPTPTPTPTLTPVPSPTPIVTPQITFDFEDDTDGWNFIPIRVNSYDIQCTGATSIFDGHRLGVTTDNVTNRFGFWDSTVGVPYQPFTLYKFSWAVSTNQTQGVTVPTFRLRVYETTNFSYGLETTLTSFTGGYMPPTTPDVATYNQYLVPIHTGDIACAFDVYDFYVGDQGVVYLEQLDVYTVPIPEDGWTTETRPTFNTWSFYNGPGPYNNVISGSVGCPQIISSLAEDRGFGYWCSPLYSVTWTPDQLYRAIFYLDSTDPNPMLGAVRIGSSDFNWTIRLRYFGAAAPGSNISEYPLYYETACGSHFFLVFEGMDFETDRGGDMGTALYNLQIARHDLLP